MKEPLRVYVMAGSSDLWRAEAFIVAANAIDGVAVTWNWPVKIREAGKPDAELTLEKRQEAAREDLLGIVAADVCVFLAPSAPSKGAQTELGFALGRDKRIVGVAPNSSPLPAGLFGALIDTWFDQDAEALAWLRGMVAGRGSLQWVADDVSESHAWRASVADLSREAVTP